MKFDSVQLKNELLYTGYSDLHCLRVKDKEIYLYIFYRKSAEHFEKNETILN